MARHKGKVGSGREDSLGEGLGAGWAVLVPVRELQSPRVAEAQRRRPGQPGMES